MDSLWVFLVQHGVEPTNNRAEVRLVSQKPELFKLWGIGSGFTGDELENLTLVSVSFRPPLVRG
jgi:hypothetical protein